MKPKDPKALFSNGTEYMSFLERNCENCRKFVHYEDATPESPCCPIEEAIALASIGSDEVEKTFPWDKLTENGHMYRYDCADFEGEDGTTHEL